jgi:hypothetical protein
LADVAVVRAHDLDPNTCSAASIAAGVFYRVYECKALAILWDGNLQARTSWLVVVLRRCSPDEGIAMRAEWATATQVEACACVRYRIVNM